MFGASVDDTAEYSVFTFCLYQLLRVVQLELVEVRPRVAGRVVRVERVEREALAVGKRQTRHKLW